MKFKYVNITLTLLISIFCFLGCNLLISSYRKVYFTPKNIGLPYEKVIIKNNRGINLSGWFIKSTDGAPCIIFCEGNGQNRAYYLRFTRFLYEAGYSVFLFDYTGFGDSEGTASELGFSRFTEDVDKAVEYVKSRSDVDSKRIGLFGWSLGGSLALYTASKRQDIKLVIIDSAMYSLLDRYTEVFNKKIGEIAAFPFVSFVRLFYSKYNPIDSIRKIKDVPILFIHGTDDIIYYKEIIRLFEAYNGPKRLVLFPHADHMENFTYYKEEYINQVLNFLNIYIREKPFNDFVTKWEYRENKTRIFIRNFTKNMLPIELRINTPQNEFIKRLMVPPGNNGYEEDTKEEPTSVITTRFYKDIQITLFGWDFYSSQLSNLNYKIRYVSKNHDLIPYARLAQDPASPENYVEAVEKKNSVLFRQNRHYLVSALILANMMSPRTSSIAESLYSNRNQEIIDNLQLFNQKMIFNPQLLKIYNKQYFPMKDPWGKRYGYDPLGREINIDEMYAMERITGKISGKSASISLFNIALLRILGIQPENVFAVHLKGSPGHTIVSFSIDNEFYIINDNMLFPGERVSWPKKEMEIYGIYNDAFYLSSNMETNFQDGDIEHIKYFMENVFKDLSWKNLRTKKVELGEPIYFPLKLKRIPSGEITNKIQLEVFKKSANNPESQYTYAKYAFQSLLVKHLEVYALAAKKSYYVKKLAESLKTQKSIIDWMNTNLRKNSIFNDESRIMMPDEVITYKTGNFFDQALLLWSFMNNNGRRAWIILTEKDSYLAYQEGRIYFIRMSNYEDVPNLKGEKVVLLFNDIESYSVWLGVNTLSSEIAEVVY
ncbi:MAG: alpha/beta fold hydrolase [Candidatus Firestonebacteria bacterium]|nr:alpha/beta fold hydrolase [Candidatus Firestonebacteria bacterium]